MQFPLKLDGGLFDDFIRTAAHQMFGDDGAGCFGIPGCVRHGTLPSDDFSNMPISTYVAGEFFYVIEMELLQLQYVKKGIWLTRGPLSISI